MKRILIIIAITAIAALARAQTTTYGGGGAPYNLVGGYNSDYSPGGTIVLTDGSVTLSGNATYEHGNNLLRNDGIWVSTSSLDLFMGTGSNTISGNIAPSFYNVNFNIGTGNSLAITNAQGIQVTNQSQFNNGITTTIRNSTHTGAIHFADNATYTGANTDAQHINGYVSKAGNDAFVFPVGSGTDLRTISISAPASATTEISTAWFAGDPGNITDPSDATVHSTDAMAAPLQSVSKLGFWDWVPVSGSDDGITVTVSMPDLGSWVDATQLRLAGWNGTQWIDLSGTATANGNNLSGTIPAGTTISALAIASTTAVLPVTWLSFDAKPGTNCSVQLEWSTATEQNSAWFYIERNEGGDVWKEIGRVKAAGNASTAQRYSFTDETPASGWNNYRLRQEDFDGRKDYSAIRPVNLDCGGSIVKVYPTLNKTGMVFVSMPSGYENAQLRLFSANGQQHAVRTTGNGLTRTVYLSSLPAGTYILQVIHQNKPANFRIVYAP